MDAERPRDRASVLRIYVARHCPNCREARRLAHVVRRLFPTLTVEVIDLADAPTNAEEVFAVPTYVLDGRVCFLGNPSEKELCALLARRFESSRRLS
jgi:glutaredoxin